MKFELSDYADYNGATHLFFTGDKEFVSALDKNADYSEIQIEYPVGYPDYDLSSISVGAGKYNDESAEIKDIYTTVISRELFDELVSQLPNNKIRPFEFGGVTGKQPTFEELPFK